MDIKQELTVFLRNQDVFTISERGVATTTDNFSGDDAEVNFDLSNTNVKNVRSVTIGGSPQTFGTDYTVDYEDSNPGRVTFTVAPGVGVDNIAIQYDYGSTDKIFPDMARKVLKLSDYPRISVEILGVTTEEVAFGATTTVSDIIISITVFAESTKKVDDSHSSVRSAILNNKKNFFYFGLITAENLSPIIDSPDRSEEIVQRTQDFRIDREYEVI